MLSPATLAQSGPNPNYLAELSCDAAPASVPSGASLCARRGSCYRRANIREEARQCSKSFDRLPSSQSTLVFSSSVPRSTAIKVTWKPGGDRKQSAASRAPSGSAKFWSGGQVKCRVSLQAGLWGNGAFWGRGTSWGWVKTSFFA